MCPCVCCNDVINKNREEERTKNDDIIITNSIASYVIPFKQHQPAIQFIFYFILFFNIPLLHTSTKGETV